MSTSSELDLVDNTSEDERSTETSLEDVFAKHFETLKDFYNRLTGEDLPTPEEFMERSTLNIRGEETEVHSSVKYESITESEEGEWRGVYLSSPNFIRYFIFLNKGDNPSDLNAFSLRVGRAARDGGVAWGEIRISTMPKQIAARVFPKSGLTRELERTRRNPRRVNRKREEFDAGMTKSFDDDERFSNVDEEEDEENSHQEDLEEDD